MTKFLIVPFIAKLLKPKSVMNNSVEKLLISAERINGIKPL